MNLSGSNKSRCNHRNSFGAVILSTSVLVAAVFILATRAAAQQPCGGVERWAVKMAADPNSQINRQPISISIHDLAEIQKGAPIPKDDSVRLPSEERLHGRRLLSQIQT
jgi:hypothetical protein